MLRRTLVAVGCAALLAGFGPLPAPAARAATSCPDSQGPLLAYNATRAWSITGSKGGGVSIGVVGAPDRIAEVACAISALAPDATVVPGSADGAIVVVADTSVDPASIGGAALVIAAAGDTGEVMSARPQGVVNVAAADESGAPLPSSASGPAVTLASYGNDTSTASGYVAALAAILRAGHANWPARQVVAQMAGSINPVSGNQHTDQLGFGIISPVQAVSQGPVDPETLPGFDAMFPVNQPPRSAPSTRSAPTSAGSAGGPTTGSSAPSSAASGTPSATPTPQVPAPGTTDSANAWPTDPVLSSGPSNGSRAGASGGGGSGGISPILLIGFLVILAGGGYLLWERRRRLKPAATKPESEWEDPSGPRHSGYSPPEE
ncbi:hypothetical protein KGQ19_23070 [Catenulispora sp. NL8]|uniref:Peptidase S8 and S53 subtilisin kexin sedolisin n=1 Tax=Catenulispora pinistramenti TaxID=2705254 RepID=A0ABS5KUL1_9ACTN|nr:hypothetical protein [Catenulispora pinistramenti]MBS2549751.1 hypothetical protein [Catenulispora pinistramenti]